MTTEQKLLIKKSWRLLRQIDPLLVGGVFYDKLFADWPSLQRMFSIPMEAQSKKLIDMLSLIVMNLDEPDDIGTEIEALALRHADYGVKPDHYGAVGKALLWTLKQGLGTDWNKEMEEAWTSCYQQLAAVMIHASHPA